MLDLKFIRQNIKHLQEALKARQVKKHQLENFKLEDEKYSQILIEVENLRQQRNNVSGKIAELKKDKKDALKLIEEMQIVSSQIKELEGKLNEAKGELDKIIYEIPNIFHNSVPIGVDENDNPEVKKVGEIKDFSFKPKSHWEIGEKLNILDFKRAAKIAGARFALYSEKGAKLERALINFMLDLHTEKHGYKEILPPFMVNYQSMTNTGQLPKFYEDLFKIENSDYFLIPTAEVPVTNMHSNEILDEKDLPIYYTAYTPCFRSEAGSYGKDTKGLIRLHQFNKVELVKFVLPQSSYEELEMLLENAEEVLKLLELPYRVISLCSGDLGFSAAKTYDIEVYMPSQKKYREISSCSNFEDFQARRGKIRFKGQDQKKPQFVHTLNGSGLAVGRCFAAILENYQEEDGSVTIPKVLQNYMGGTKTIQLAKP